MKNVPYEAKAYMILTALVLIFGISTILHDFRYELGLNKPSFKVGQCLIEDYSNEFEITKYKSVVLEIGKKEYLLYTFGKNEEVYKPGWKEVRSIENLDNSATLISCPSSKDILPEKSK